MGRSMVGLMIGGSVNCKAADIVELTVHLQACLMAVQTVAAKVGLTEKKKVGNLVALLVFLNGPFGRQGKSGWLDVGFCDDDREVGSLEGS
jgi:hypothetical protein